MTDRNRTPVTSEPLEPRRLLATFAVTTAADVVDPDDGVTSLREAIAMANAAAGADEIRVASAIQGAVSLLQGGQLVIEDDLALNLPMTLNAAGQSRVIDVAAGVTVAMNDATLLNGFAGGNSAGTATGTTAGGALRAGLNADVSLIRVTIANSSATDGGGVWARGPLTLVDSTVTGNAATDAAPGADAFGGGVFAFGALTITRGTIAGNTAGSGAADGFGGGVASNLAPTISGGDIDNNDATRTGGGLYLANGGTLDGVTLVGNTAQAGGAVGSFGPLTLVGGELRNNDADALGGGVFADVGLTVTGTGFIGNTSGDTGGGVATFGPSTLTDATLTGNTANESGGGIYAEGFPATPNAIRLPDARGVDRPVNGDITRGLTTPAARRVLPASGFGREVISGPVLAAAPPPIEGAALTLTGSSVTGSQAAGVAGVDVLLGSVNVVGSRIAGNASTGDGLLVVGGLGVDGGDLFLDRSEISDNAGPGGAGGLSVAASAGDVGVTVLNSTIANNTGTRAGVDLASVGGFTVEADFVHATISGNEATGSGAVGGVTLEVDDPDGFVAAVFANSVLSANTADRAVSNLATTEDGVPGNPDDAAYLPATRGGNVLGSDFAPAQPDPSITDVVTDDPGLGALAFNGGATRTMLPQAGSAAIDAGDDALAEDPGDGSPLTVDQRGVGFDRLVGQAVDAGAAEAGNLFDADPPTLTRFEFVFDTQTDPGTQLGDHQLVLEFDEDVSESLTLADLTVLNNTAGTTVDLAGSSLVFGDGGTTATVLLAQRFGNARFTAVLDGEGVSDAAGNVLGDDEAIDFFWLEGDANRDGRVDGRDVQPIRLNLGNRNSVFSQGDTNYDGRVDGRDVQAIRLNLGERV